MQQFSPYAIPTLQAYVEKKKFYAFTVHIFAHGFFKPLDYVSHNIFARQAQMRPQILINFLHFVSSVAVCDAMISKFSQNGAYRELHCGKKHAQAGCVATLI